MRAAVVDAVLAELSSGGYDALTVEQVATRSGVHKATLYRRWGGVDGLVAEALAHSAEAEWAIPDTGSLADDLRAVTHAVLVGFTDPAYGGAATALISAALRSTQGAQALASFFATRLHDAAAVVTRAVERGELPAGVDAVEVIRTATAPLYFRLFITGEPLDKAIADRAAAAALAATEAGVFTA
ncbi:TetR/AcrR family transcriptional regulator [Labedaea rhizosphaerae]|uniref:TetR family transcriptional regulator n=1 Tax=Labedaea rhizosphaerae TaxID=598644 RepID=A0A4V3CYN9_LABRH|nr:TetR/AcrR family transcriptional regulator [Labedaea rhizosphaerae]TDP94898.1 TetR family transcriptional regulator [Labedaea rhizosphaerae]